MRKFWIVAAFALLVSCSPAISPQASPAAPAAQPKAGGILKYIIRAAPGNWDQHLKTAGAAGYTLPVFNNLVRFDITKAELSPQNIEGDLAERWETSADGKTITFYLRKNVKWHNGKPFTADDVVYSIEKMTDPKRSATSPDFPAFQSVAKTDDYTVKIGLGRPSSSFVPVLASGYCVIQSKDSASTPNQSTDFLMGTGPFKFKNFTSGISFDLVKNPDYFRRGFPYLDGVTLAIVPDASAQVDAFITNKVDMSSPTYGIQSQTVLERYQSQAPGAVITWTKFQFGDSLVLNLSRPVTKDLRVRQALSMVTDMKQAITAGFGSDRFRNLDKAVLAPAYGLPASEISQALGWDKPYDQRVAEAKKLMADAGFANGAKLTMIGANSQAYVQLMQALADMYRRTLNVDVEIKALLGPELFTARAARTWDISAGSLDSMVGDPDEIASYFKTGTTANISGFSDPNVDKVIDQQSQELDFAKRKQLAQQMEKAVLSQVVVIPTGLQQFPAAWWPYVKGFIPQESTVLPYFNMERTWLDK